ncbi:MAG: hypothetical protein EZS28_033378 [Streblomastix strix]|uniref:Uncharacterized protein n=1 Tax=Streblomastix strix TaxID=222440 RepID=A0A5J4UMV3_9EUKA|nr:MAG: hypothetical protein EZS28_033378 [Streblomastix strix]
MKSKTRYSSRFHERYEHKNQQKLKNALLTCQFRSYSNGYPPHIHELNVGNAVKVCRLQVTEPRKLKDNHEGDWLLKLVQTASLSELASSIAFGIVHDNETYQEDGEWAGVRAELPERRPRAADKFMLNKADTCAQAAYIPRGAGPVRVHAWVLRAVIPAAFGQAS